MDRMVECSFFFLLFLGVLLSFFLVSVFFVLFPSIFSFPSSPLCVITFFLFIPFFFHLVPRFVPSRRY
jgi:hypothetical protein